MKRFICSAFMISVLVIGSSAMAFADSSSVPAHLNVTASAVSFTITEKINMTAAAGSPDLTIDDLVVTNTGSMGKIKLESLNVNAEQGWTLVADDTDFKNMSVDQKKFSLVSESHDFAANADMSVGKTANPDEQITMKFKGNTGASSSAITDTKVATIVATIALA